MQQYTEIRTADDVTEQQYTEIRTADDVTEEVTQIALDIADGWYQTGRIDTTAA